MRASFALAGTCILLAGCVAPMRQGEAQMLAAAGLRRFCRDQPCGPTKLVAAQKIKDRWLVDFDAPAGKYTVTVDTGGNTQVSIWSKTSPLHQ